MILQLWLGSLIYLGLRVLTPSEPPPEEPKSLISSEEPKDLEIVLARCKEDLTWVDDLGYGSVATVYDKCGVHAGPGKHVTQQNIGREGGTYLRHIVDNYDNLAAWTVFSSAEQPMYGFRGPWTLDLGGGHLMNTVRFEDYVEASKNKEAAPSFFVFTTAMTQTDSVLYQCFRKGYGEEYEAPVSGISRCGVLQHWQHWVQFPDWFAVSVSKLQQEQGAPWPDINLDATMELFEVAPAKKVLFFAQGARFAASREAIQSRSKDYYLKLLSHMEHADPWAGYFLEWMWFYVLTGEQSACGYENSLAPLPSKGRLEITQATSDVRASDFNDTATPSPANVTDADVADNGNNAALAALAALAVIPIVALLGCLVAANIYGGRGTGAEFFTGPFGDVETAPFPTPSNSVAAGSAPGFTYL